MDYSNWISYTRVSTQDKDQLRALQYHIERLMGLGLAYEQIFWDVESGDESGRENFQRVLGLLSSGSVSGLLMARQDRATRNVADWEKVLELVNKHRIQVAFLDEVNIDLSTPDGKFISRIRAAQAAFFRDELIKKIRIGQDMRRRQGKTHVAPFGYVIGPTGFLEIDYTPLGGGTVYEAARWIVDRFLVLQSAYRVAKEYNETWADLPSSLDPKTRKGRKRTGRSGWTPAGIKTWLLNPVLRGHTRFGVRSLALQSPMTLYNTHEPIITPEEGRQIDELFGTIRQRSKSRGAGRSCLRGLVYCATCGRHCTMWANATELRPDTKTRYEYYRCSGWPDRLCQQKRSVRKDKIENLILSRLQGRAQRLVQDALQPDPSPELADPRYLELLGQIEALRRVPGKDPTIEHLIQQKEGELNGLRGFGRNKDAVSESSRERLVELCQRPLWKEIFMRLPESERRLVYLRYVSRVWLQADGTEEIALIEE